MSTAENKNMDKAKTQDTSSSTKVKVTKYLEAFSGKAPEKVRPYILQAAPVVGLVVEKLEKLVPVLVGIYERLLIQYRKLEPYHPELLLPSLVGLILCFFGGSFLTLIAAVEAYRMSGLDTTVLCVKHLIDDFQKVVEANKKDDEVDNDNDGVPDTLQVSNKELVKRKTLLFLRTVEPKRISEAISGITAGFLAVTATLKLQFAKAITLGNAIGDMLDVPAKKLILPVLSAALPTEYKKWAEPVLSYSIKSVSISIAWTIQRVISAFHSALRGGLMFSRNIMEYLSIMKIYEINHEESYLDEIVGYVVAGLGLMFQLRTGFTLPFPLNVLLLPFSLVEWALMWVISK